MMKQIEINGKSYTPKLTIGGLEYLEENGIDLKDLKEGMKISILVRVLHATLMHEGITLDDIRSLDIQAMPNMIEALNFDMGADLASDTEKEVKP